MQFNQSIYLSFKGITKYCGSTCTCKSQISWSKQHQLTSPYILVTQKVTLTTPKRHHQVPSHHYHHPPNNKQSTRLDVISCKQRHHLAVDIRLFSKASPRNYLHKPQNRAQIPDSNDQERLIVGKLITLAVSSAPCLIQDLKSIDVIKENLQSAFSKEFYV